MERGDVLQGACSTDLKKECSSQLEFHHTAVFWASTADQLKLSKQLLNVLDSRGESHLLTELVLAMLADLAVPAHLTRLECHPVSLLEALYV